MAPVLSKAKLPPPRNSKEAIAQAVGKARPLLDSMFGLIQETSTFGRICFSEVATTLERISRQVDRFFYCCTGILENFCFCDFQRATRGPKTPLQGSLPILFVLMLLVMLYNAFVFGYMPAMGIAVNSRTSLIFHAWIFLVLASFVQAVQTDPGTVPDTREWKTHGCPPDECKERKRGSDEARWCRKTESYKPDRAHYCRVCRRSVLRMDHHCPWLGNTIGFYNHKYFFLFLLYTNAACAQLGFSIIQLLVQMTLPALTTFLLIGAEGLTALLGSILVPFLCFHFWLLARNMTTIEFCEKLRSKEEGEEEEDGPEVNGRSIYDQGIFRNFCAVLGSNPLMWLLPFGGPAGDGISFPLRSDIRKALKDKKRKAAKELADASKAGDEEDPELGGKLAPEATHPEGNDQAENEEEDEEEDEYAKGDDVDLEAGDEDHGDAAGSSGRMPLLSSKVKRRSQADHKLLDDVMDSAFNEDTDHDSNNEDALSVAASSTAPSEGADDGFLVWRSPKEFAEDLTIGCQFIGEKLCMPCEKLRPMDKLYQLASACMFRKQAPQLENLQRKPKGAREPRSMRGSKVVAAPRGGRLLDDDSASSGSRSSENAGGNVGHAFLSD